MCKVFCELAVNDHVIFRIAENIGFAIASDCSKFNSKRIASVLIVLDGMVVAAATVKELATAVNRAIRQVEPEIFSLVTPVT